MTRDEIVRVARSYVDTPFHHAGRTPGLALDCAGVLICVGRELGLWSADFDVPQYTPNPDGHTMIELCEKHLVRIPREVARPGDVICTISSRDPQHLGVLADYRHGGLSVVHASNATRPPRVVEQRLMFYARMRLASVFSFPGVIS